jgi:hypothetical protein
MSSVEGSRARTSQTPVGEPELKAGGRDSGSSSPDAFACYDPDSSSWKMLGRLPFEGWTAFLETLPRSGSMRSGRLYRRALWVPHTHESGCSSWPTPVASGGDNCGGSGSQKAALRKGTYVSGRVNPSLYEWLMGFPIGWTEIAV